MTVKQRTYFSIQHIQSAALFARKTAQIEREYDGAFSAEILTDHRANVMASLFMAVSFLEGTINELFADAAEQYGGYAEKLDPHIRSLMAKMWQQGVPRTSSYPIMDKFDLALTMAGKPLFSRGEPPAQSIVILVKLRNDLVHYEPEWILAGEDSAQADGKKSNLAKQLRGKFSLNPLVSEGNAFYPDKCLSHGCAQWGVVSSLAYADEFYTRLGIPAPYEHIRHCL